MNMFISESFMAMKLIATMESVKNTSVKNVAYTNGSKLMKTYGSFNCSRPNRETKTLAKIHANM